jgi:hypothetical protein
MNFSAYEDFHTNQTQYTRQKGGGGGYFETWQFRGHIVSDVRMTDE